MEKQKIVINGNHFSDIEGFYDEAYRVLTSGLDWQPAHNLDALNDILYGGFGTFSLGEPIVLEWINYPKSRKDLGREPSIRYYESRAAGLSGKRADYFQGLADQLKTGGGETLIGMISGMIGERQNIRFIAR